MRKIIAASVLAMALAVPVAGSATTGDSCLAIAGSSCQIVAGPQNGNAVVAGTTILGGRGSWIAGGDWTIQMFYADDCSGEPYRTYSSADNNAPGGLGDANNGGGYYGSCVRATAGENGFVLLGAMHTDLLP